MDRRTFLASLGLVPALRSWQQQDLAALARRVRTSNPAVALDVLLGLHAEGIGWRAGLGALFLAGVSEIRPRPVGFQLHAVMLIGALYQLCPRAREADKWHLLHFALTDYHRSAGIDQAQGAWTLPERPLPLPGGTAQAAFARSFAAQDLAAADRAIATLHGECRIDELFELLWPLALRDFENLGHHPIFADQVYRTLQEIGWQHGEPAVRSLVHGFLPSERTSWPIHAANEKRAGSMRDGWQAGLPDRERSLRIAAKLNDLDAAGAAEFVTRESQEGASGPTLWDALRLAGHGILRAKPGILAVHPVTVLQALHAISERSRREETRRLALLQAASWMALYREQLVRGPVRELLGALAPGAEPPQSAEQVFAAAGEDRLGAERMAIALPAAQAEAFAEAAVARLAHKGVEHHDHKLLAAVLETATLAPQVAPLLRAASLAYIKHDGRPDSPRYEESKAAIAEHCG